MSFSLAKVISQRSIFTHNSISKNNSNIVGGGKPSSIRTVLRNCTQTIIASQNSMSLNKQTSDEEWKKLLNAEEVIY